MTSNSNNQKKKMTRHHSSPFPACFRPPSTTPALDYHHSPPPSAITTTTPNLTTSLYQTHLGLFSLTWSRSFLTRTLHLNLHPSSSATPSPPSSSSPSFHLTLKPFLFWSKQGIKKLPFDGKDPLHIVWDFTNSKFGPGPEPESGYYIAVISSSSTTVLFVGDMERAFHSRMTKSGNNSKNNDIVSPGGTQFRTHQSMVVRREHVCGNQFYTTKTNLGGKTRKILIELNKSIEDDPRLVIRFDNKRVIQVKHLKWKFRGSERIDVDGHRIHLSWDVYNWLFDDDSAAGGGDEGYALFTFRFEAEDGDVSNNTGSAASVGAAMWRRRSSERVVSWSQDSCGLSYERKKMKKKLLVKTRSSSSSSLSSASSSGSSSSVLEWESVEENELKGPTGFSLLVYAWKS